MKDKKTLKYIIVIAVLLITIGLLWYFMISGNTTTTNNNSTNNSQQNSNNTTYSSAKTISSDEDLSNVEFTSTNSDENAILVTNAKSTLSDITVNKEGDSNGGDNTSFYGTNSGILAKDGAVLTIKNATINTNATGANGVFSYGGSATTNNSSSDGTTVNISNSKITTTKDNSGGIMTTGGGVMNATNLEITTNGTSSAAIRSDRGGGTVTVNKGIYTTTGKGSPAVYSTADITVKNATLVSKVTSVLGLIPFFVSTHSSIISGIPP